MTIALAAQSLSDVLPSAKIKIVPLFETIIVGILNV